MAEMPLTGITIAVTRPLDQAEALCDVINDLGGKAVSFPLLAITPLDDYSVFEQQLAQLATSDWAIFISSNAVNYAMPRMLKHFGNVPNNLRFAAIGHQTARELGHYGVHNVLIPRTRFDSETLLALPEMQDVASLKIAIFRGVGGRDLMADTLKSRGAEVFFAECYRRVNPQTNTHMLTDLWNNNDLQAIVVTSSEAMRFLIDMARNQDWLKNISIFVNHARIAELPLSLGLEVHIADAGGDEALLRKIIEIKLQAS